MMQTPTSSDLEVLHNRVTALEMTVRQITESSTLASKELTSTHENRAPKYRIVESRQGRLFLIEQYKDGGWKTVIRRTTRHAALEMYERIKNN